MTDQERERIEHLERQVALLSAAVAELGLQAFPELNTLSPVSGSASARLRRYAGNVLRVVDLYGPDDTYASDLDKFARRREEAAKQPRILSEAEAAAIKHRALNPIPEAVS